MYDSVSRISVKCLAVVAAVTANGARVFEVNGHVVTILDVDAYLASAA